MISSGDLDSKEITYNSYHLIQHGAVFPFSLLTSFG